MKKITVVASYVCYSFNYVEKAKHFRENNFRENNYIGKPNIVHRRQVLRKEDLIHIGQEVSFCFQSCAISITKHHE